MNAEPDPPGAIDCLRRGLASLRANWELAFAVWVQLVLVGGLLVAGFGVLLAGLGVSAVAWLRDLGPDWPRRLADDLATGLETGPPALLPLLPPLIAATLLWTVAFCLYCYLQGGVTGVLVRAETAAGDGSPGWRTFRAFSAGVFDRQGRRLYWRYFWLNHLVGGVALAWGLLALGLVAVAGWLAGGAGLELGIAAGCFGLAPLALLAVVAGLWSTVAAVEIARPGARVGSAARRALGELGRKPGALLAICGLWLVASMVAAAAFSPLEWAVSWASGDSLPIWLAWRATLALVRSLVNCALFVAVVGSLAALLGMRPAPAAAEAAA